MMRENVFRFLLTLALLGFAGFVYYRSGVVPEWLIGLTGMAVGNTFRLQMAPKK